MEKMDLTVARPSTPDPTPTPTKVEKSSQPSTLTQEKSGDMPLEVYVKENTNKYIDKLLEVDNLLPDTTRESIDSIDAYIIQLMTERGYNPTTEAYRATLEGFKKELGIDKNTSLEATLERMEKYIDAENMLKSLKDIDEEKILKQLKKSPTQDLIPLILKTIEKRGIL